MREQYMKELKEALQHVDPQVEKEIMEDFQAHFEMGLEEGKTEKELAEELGDPKELAKALEEEYGRFEAPGKAEPEVEDTKKREFGENGTDYSSEDSVDFEDREGKVKAMKLDMVIAEIRVSLSKDGVFRASYENSVSKGIFKRKIHYNAYVSGDTFIAKEEVSQGSGRSWSTLEVEVPEDFSRMTISTVSGDVEIEKIHAKESISLSSVSGDWYMADLLTEELRISATSGDVEGNRIKATMVRTSTVSGEVRFEKLHCEDFNAGTTSGDVELEQLVYHTLNVESVSGDINGEALVGETMEINTTSGDVELTLSNETGYTVSAQTMSGDVEMDFAEKVSKGYVGEKYRGVIGDGASRVFVKTLSGDITIG